MSLVWPVGDTKAGGVTSPLPRLPGRHGRALADPLAPDLELACTTHQRLRRHETKVQQQVADLQEALGIIHMKVEIYARHLAAGTADQLWLNGPECD
jgi:hypothetical protein